MFTAFRRNLASVWTLGAAEESLATLDGYPVPIPEFSAALRQLAARTT